MVQVRNGRSDVPAHSKIQPGLAFPPSQMARKKNPHRTLWKKGTSEHGTSCGTGERAAAADLIGAGADGGSAGGSLGLDDGTLAQFSPVRPSSFTSSPLHVCSCSSWTTPPASSRPRRAPVPVLEDGWRFLLLGAAWFARPRGPRAGCLVPGHAVDACVRLRPSSFLIHGAKKGIVLVLFNANYMEETFSVEYCKKRHSISEATCRRFDRHSVEY
jgi:hypothetical protein